MKMAGAARMSAATCYPVANIRVKRRATVDSVANARCKYMLPAFAAVFQKKSLVLREMTRRNRIPLQRRSGLRAHSAVKQSANGSTTVASTHAPRSATLRLKTRPTAHLLQISSLTALAERHH